jgi:beta-glucanase (GH16 family)/regulation of enolase protein 1 (concanavalin A-like superfamily)
LLPPGRLRGVPALIGALALAGSLQSQPVPPVPGSWTLLFQDEFDGATVDGTKWRLGTHHAGIAGSGGIAPENVSIADGKLKMKVEQRAVAYSGTNYNYATGEISTFFNHRQQHGYIEARIKYPAVTGLWPAFWLMPDRGSYGWRDAHRRAYLKFDLTGVDPGTVTSATLKLTVSSFDTGGTNNLLVMKLAEDSWSESTLTWNNKPAPNPIWIEQRWNNQVVAGTEITIDVTGYVAQEMSGDKIVSLVLADTFARTKLLAFHSSEATNTAVRPQLVINGTAYTATEDATVRWGTLANNNYGSAVDLGVKDDWGDTATTFSDGMEVDIMESLGIWGPNVTSHALHWDGYDTQHKTTSWSKIPYAASPDGFHTYGVYWEPGRLAFYINGVKTGEHVNARVMSVPAYFLLSLQLGGWDNNNAGPQVHNQVMEVDYVRSWSGTRSEPPASPPAPWTGGDIGTVDAAGSASETGGVFTVYGSGADIALLEDAFHFVRQPVTGDFDIRARVTFQTNTHTWAKAGVMIRDTLQPNSPHATMVVTPGNGFRSLSRSTAGGDTTTLSGGGLNTSPNNWVRLVRSGSTFIAYKSSNGTSWTQVSSTTIAMGATVYAGLPVCSHNVSSSSRVVFDNVSVTVAPPPPADPMVGHYTFDAASGTIVNQGSGGSALDFTNTGGTTGRDNTGTGGYGATAFTGYGSAFNVLASGDNNYHTTTSSVGGGALTAGAVPQSSLQGTDGSFTYEAFVSLSTTAGEQNILAHDGDSIRGFLFRVNAGTLSFYDGTAAFAATIPTTGTHAFVANDWYHVAVTYDGQAGVAGNLKFYWTALNGSPAAANQIGTGTIGADLNSSVSNLLGAGTTTRQLHRYELRGLVDEVRINLGALAANAFVAFAQSGSLTGGDIGAAGVAGSTSYSAGVFTVAGSGADITGAADAFHFARMPASGDCDIRVRVASQGNTNTWAKAGVMIRESLAPGSKFALMAVTPGNGFRFQSRATTSGSATSSVAGGSLNSAPNNWVRLTRTGSTFTGYKSVDGVNWTLVTSVTLTMGTDVYIGLPVCSHDNTVLSTVTFDNLTATP